MKKHDNYASNLAVLEQAGDQDLSNEFIALGIINKFTLQFELAWKLLKATLAYEGIPESATGSPRQIIKAAYASYDFLEEGIWLEMLNARNDVSHIYDKAAAQKLARRVIDTYTPEFKTLLSHLEDLYDGVLF